MDPNILVQHIFNYSFTKSFWNAVRKSRYWTHYSITNKDMLSDSGTASHELKANVVIFYAALFCLALIPLMPSVFAPLMLLLTLANVFISRRLINAFYNAYGTYFSLSALLYYFGIYPIPVGIGGLMGVSTYVRKRSKTKVRT
jgi:hypothetical protein